MTYLRAMAYVAFDLEATFHPSIGRHEIIELGAYRLDVPTLLPQSAFESLVHPPAPISWQIAQKTGITNEMVQNAAPIEEVWDRFASFIGGSVLLAHQASLDISVLRKTAAGHSLPPLNNPVIDTLKLAKKLYPRRSSYALASFQEELGVVLPAHRALADAYVTGYLFRQLIERFETEHAMTQYDDLWDYCYPKTPEQLRLF